jgi:hypothetical protein
MCGCKYTELSDVYLACGSYLRPLGRAWLGFQYTAGISQAEKLDPMGR